MKCPRKYSKENNRDVNPEGLNVLELRGEVALKIVLEDKDAEEIGIAAGAEDVPGERGETETGDGHGMKAAKGVAPASGRDGPEENGAAREKDGRRAFRERG